MSTVSGIHSATQASSAGKATGGANSLGKDDFLKLLTVQLQNQDPTKPVNNEQWIAELAQFSTLDQMTDVSKQLANLSQIMTSSSSLSTASLVGKSVTYDNGGAVDVVAGATPSLQINLASPATVTAVIQDASGRTVRTLDAGAHAAGTSDLGWDGRDGNGNTVPAGHYSVALSATAADGSAVSVSTRARGVVTGVSLSNGTTQLMIGGDLVDLTDIVQISQP